MLPTPARKRRSYSKSIHPRSVREGDRNRTDKMRFISLIVRLRALVGHGTESGKM